MQRCKVGAQTDDDIAGRERKGEGFGHDGTPAIYVGGPIAGGGPKATH
jgi:protein-disulfide isomerase